MKYLLPMLLVLAGCKINPLTGEEEVDWAKVDVAGDEVVGLLEDQAALWAHKPETAETFQRLADAVALLDTAVAAYAASGEGGPDDIARYLDAAINLADELKAGLDPQEERDMFAAMSGVRRALGLIRILIT